MRRLVCLAPLLVSLGCTEPEPILIGHFGGRLLELTASGNSGRFRLTCGQIVTPPLREDGTGSIRVSGSGQFQGAVSQPINVDVEVQIIDAMNVTAVLTFPSGTVDSYQLRRNASGDFSGVGCLA